jgi:hypothetical protein
MRREKSPAVDRSPHGRAPNAYGLVPGRKVESRMPWGEATAFLGLPGRATPPYKRQDRVQLPAGPVRHSIGLGACSARPASRRR